MCDRQLILDTSVLSAFASGNWFHNISFWDAEYAILTTEQIWAREFIPHHEQVKPAWLAVECVDTAKLESKSVELGEADWTLIRLAETVEDPILVSNDRRLIAEVNQRGLEPMWGTKFLMQTFEACGISEASFADGLSAYIADVPLPTDVEREVKSTEKQ